MRKLFYRVLSVMLTSVLLLHAFCVQAADVNVSLKEALDSVGDYCYESVTDPGYGSEWFLYCFALADYDVSDSYRDSYYDALCAELKSCGGELDTRKYTEYSRVILALTALGFDPTNAAGYDLTLPLADFDATVRQGLNGAVFALLALDSGNYRIPVTEEGKTQATREKYVTYIVERQMTDGGFSVSGSTSDPDVTAMALQALAKYEDRTDVDSAIQRGLSYLSNVQLEDGGFDNWGIENAESCAQVILALCELGISLEDERFIKNDMTVLDALLCYRNDDGGFRHTEAGGTDMLATRQAYMALASLWRTQNGKSPFYSIGGRVAFHDMEGHANCEAVMALAREGILSGRGDGTFDADATMTRAEFAALIVRAIAVEPVYIDRFSDVSKNAWYAAYIGAAYENGIVRGVTETLFAPDTVITDSEAEVMVARAARLLGLEPETSETWHASSVHITRGAVAQMLYDLLNGAGRI